MAEASHELLVFGGPYAAVGIDDSCLAHGLAPHILLPLLISERAVDFEAAASGRGIKAGDRGSVIIFVRVC